MSPRGKGLPAIEKHALDRWMYRKSGMDYGPFSTKDIQDMITGRQVDEDTEILNHRSRHWTRLVDEPAFGGFITQMRTKETEHKRQQQLEDSVMRVQRSMSSHKRIPYALAAILLVAVGAGLYFFLQPPAPVSGGLTFDVFKVLSFERLPLIRKTMASPATKPVAKATRKKKSSKSARNRNQWGNGARAAQVNTPAPQVDLSFDAEDPSGGRELTRGDLDSIQKRASPRLIRCFRTEASADAAFRGGVVTLYILTSGRVALSRLNTRPAPSPTLAACVRGAVKGLRVPAFAGANQVMEIPLHVAAAR
ncbi:MAG: hypothetical protein ISR64_01965 [Deltaproteobacteria bacterium]|nr:hypothetical protein [Deltaproteobacteria bacterium]